MDVVLNFDIPTHSKDYIHRVGRTARAGRSGKAVTFVTQYDVELYQRIEHLLGKQLPQYKCEEDEVMSLQERVSEAQRTAKMEMKDIDDRKGGGGGGGKRGRGGDDDDTEEFLGARKRLNNGNSKSSGRGRGGFGKSSGRGRGGGGSRGRGGYGGNNYKNKFKKG